MRPLAELMRAKAEVDLFAPSSFFPVPSIYLPHCRPKSPSMAHIPFSGPHSDFCFHSRVLPLLPLRIFTCPPGPPGPIQNFTPPTDPDKPAGRPC